MKFNETFTEENYSSHLKWLEGDEGKRLDLSFTDLSNADLRGATLRNATLRNADLSFTDLRNADLSNANLRDCIGNDKEIKSFQFGTYIVAIYENIINIGCKTHTLEEWKAFTDEEIYKMDSGALDWWKLNKDIVIQLAERS